MRPYDDSVNVKIAPGPIEFLLFLPSNRKRRHQLRQSHIRRLAPIEYSLDDGRCQQR
jgi:hypothetical protein